MPKRFWIITTIIQSIIVVFFTFKAGIMIGVELFLIVVVFNVLLALLMSAREQWRRISGLEDIERKEQS